MSESACIWPGSSLALAAKAPAAQLGTVNCTTKTVPVFSGTYAAGNSPISVPGDNVWFGAASPNVHRRRTDVVMGSESPEKFLKSAGPYPMSMAGIYSTKPGVIGQLQKIRKSADMVPMAAVGIEPAKVSAERRHHRSRRFVGPVFDARLRHGGHRPEQDSRRRHREGTGQARLRNECHRHSGDAVLDPQPNGELCGLPIEKDKKNGCADSCSKRNPGNFSQAARAEISDPRFDLVHRGSDMSSSDQTLSWVESIVSTENDLRLTQDAWLRSALLKSQW